MILDTKRTMRTIFLGMVIIALWAAFGLNEANAGIIGKPPTNLGLVGYWAMNEGTGAYAGDSSGNKNTGVLTSGPTWVDGKRGKALNFDGSDDYVLIPNSSGAGHVLNLLGGPATFSVWAKPSTLNGTFVAKRDGTSIEYQFYIVATAATYDLAYQWGDSVGNVDSWFTSGDQTLDKNWHHYAVVVGSNDVVSAFYIDGVSLAFTQPGTTGTSPANRGVNVTLGARLAGAPTPGFLLTGSMDEVRVYNRALSAGEIQALYKSGAAKFTALPSNLGLVGYWAMNENTGTIAGDFSGNGNRGVLTGGPTWVDGKRGKALNFDGVNDYVDAGSGASLDNIRTYTVSAWIYPRSFGGGGFGRIYDKNSTTGRLLFLCDIAASCAGGLTNTFQVYQGFATDGKWSPSSNSIVLNKWTHVAVTYNNAAESVSVDPIIYINGVSVAVIEVITPVGAIDDDSAGSFLIGDAPAFNRQFNGLIDEFRVYNRVLSAGEIQALYQADYAKVNASQNNQLTNGLVGLWSFNGPDMSGVTAYDRSGQGNNGTLTNGPALAPGKLGQALSFSGTSEVQWPSIAYSNTVGTISAWVRVNDFGSSFSTNPNVYGTDLNLCAGKAFYFGTGGYLRYEEWAETEICGDTISFRAEASQSLSVGSWYHIAYTSGSSGNSIYINGERVAVSYTGGGSASTQNFLGSGVKLSSARNGLIDEVRMYDRALTPAEIKRLYNMGR